MKRIRLALIAVAVAAGLGGCASSPQQCDPRNENFFNNTSCLASGAYVQRQRALQAGIEQEQQRSAAFHALLVELNAEQAQASRTLQETQREFERLTGAWNQVKRGISAEAQRSRRLRERIAQIEQELAIYGDPALAADLAHKTELRDDLRQTLRLLQQELDAGVYD